MGRTSDARERLMGAAHDLIWEYSFGAVTIDAICDRAGVKKGSFYYFFESKSDLAVAAVQAWWETRIESIKVIFHPEVPPLERIRNYIEFIAAQQIQHFEETGNILGCPMFCLGSEMCTQDGKLKSLVNEILVKGRGNFEVALKDAQRDGDLDGGSVAMKARMLWAFYEGTLVRARIENNPEYLRTLSSDAMALIGAPAILPQSLKAA